MKKISIESGSTPSRETSIASSMPAAVTWPAVLHGETSGLLQRMFRDPRALESSQRGELIAQLRAAVELEPRVPEIRVLLGMALCVDLQAQEAMEQLREATRQAPDCFIARLKFGELLMRLRICRQAAEETQKAAQLATNDFQAELARKQAAEIRTMLREGIERGGYAGSLSRLIPFRRRSDKSETATALAGSR
jgi:cytochrome c-type biogenesis protein CcmH/NrfG